MPLKNMAKMLEFKKEYKIKGEKSEGYCWHSLEETISAVLPVLKNISPDFEMPLNHEVERFLNWLERKYGQK